jgi:hypothetical protein
MLKKVCNYRDVKNANPLPGSTSDLGLGLLKQDFPELLVQYLLLLVTELQQ